MPFCRSVPRGEIKCLDTETEYILGLGHDTLDRLEF